MKITDLIPDEHNANLGTERGLRMLADSLRKHGVGRSILVDKEGRVIAGNKTLAQAIEAGIEDLLVVETDGSQLVAVKRLDLDLNDGDRARELAYADNRTSEIGLDWNADQLLADLEGGLDLSELFGKDELDELLKGLAPEPPEDKGPQIDKAAELQEKWGTATGQIWQLGEHRLAVGDCTDRAVVEAVMRGERAVAQWHDPPYGIDYQNYHLGPKNFQHPKVIGDQEVGDGWLDNAKIIAALDSAQYVCTRFDVYPEWKEHIAKRFDFRNAIVWVKSIHTGGDLIGNYGYKYELILYSSYGNHKLCAPKRDVNIWEIPSIYTMGERHHPTEKPTALVERALQNSTKEGNILADFFCGSGISVLACERLNRRCRAIEIHPPYAAVTIQRWVDMVGGEPRLIEL